MGLFLFMLLVLKRTGWVYDWPMKIYLLLLGGSLLGSWFLSSLLGSRLLCGLLGSRLLGGLLCLLGLVGLWLLWLLSSLGFLNLDNLVASSSFAGGSGHLEGSLGNSTLEGHADLDSGLSSINLVVSTDVLKDGLTGGASAVLEGGDGSSNHHGVLGVGSRLGSLLGLWCSGRSRHLGFA